MKLITLAIISLNRIGTLSGGGGFQQSFGSGSRGPARHVVPIDEESSVQVLAKVQELAVAAGESRGGVERLEVAFEMGRRAGPYVLRERIGATTGTFYGEAYADCEVFPALEAEGRYFRLSEVERS